jgi:hypothetical protein
MAVLPKFQFKMLPKGGLRVGNEELVKAVAPEILAMEPSEGPAEGGTVVTITGQKFHLVEDVLMAGISVQTLTVNSKDEIVVTTPDVGNLVGTRDVQIISKVTNSEEVTFNFLPIVDIVSLSQTGGNVAGGDTVTITGSGFISTTEVLFGAVPASFSVLSNTEIEVVTPAQAAAEVDVTVTNLHSTDTLAASFIYADTPVISNISPNTGPANEVVPVIISGTGFKSGAVDSITDVEIDGSPVAFTVLTGTQISLDIPDDLAANTTVTIEIVGYGGQDSDTYTPELIVTAVSPVYGTTLGGTNVVITGTGFSQVDQVLFGTEIASLNSNSTNLVDVDTPVSPVDGSVEVVVQTPAGNSISSTPSANDFLYIGDPEVVSSDYPVVIGDTTVDIRLTGSNLTTSTSVNFVKTTEDYDADVKTDAALGYWKFNETSGTFLNTEISEGDLLGGVSGVVSGTPDLTTLSANPANSSESSLEFDGTSSGDYVTITLNSLLPPLPELPPTDFSVEFWTKITKNTVSANTPLVTLYDPADTGFTGGGGSPRYVQIGVERPDSASAPNRIWRFYVRYLLNSVSLTAHHYWVEGVRGSMVNQPIHVVTSLSGNTATLYINGDGTSGDLFDVNPIPDVTDGGFQEPAPIKQIRVGNISGLSGVAVDNADAIISDLAFYKHALSQDQILDHIATGMPSEAGTSVSVINDSTLDVTTPETNFGSTVDIEITNDTSTNTSSDKILFAEESTQIQIINDGSDPTVSPHLNTNWSAEDFTAHIASGTFITDSITPTAQITGSHLRTLKTITPAKIVCIRSLGGVANESDVKTAACIIRFQDANNYIMAGHFASLGLTKISKVEGGIETVLASIAHDSIPSLSSEQFHVVYDDGFNIKVESLTLLPSVSTKQIKTVSTTSSFNAGVAEAGFYIQAQQQSSGDGIVLWKPSAGTVDLTDPGHPFRQSGTFSIYV